MVSLGKRKFQIISITGNEVREFPQHPSFHTKYKSMKFTNVKSISRCLTIRRLTRWKF
jgi:hypothetical protein